VLRSNFVKYGSWKIDKIVRCLADKKTKLCLALQVALLLRSSPKCVKASRRECTQSVPDFTKIEGRLAELGLYPNTMKMGRNKIVSNIRLKPSFNRITETESYTKHSEQNNSKLEMWANAQRHGRPAEHRWRPLFNAAKFG